MRIAIVQMTSGIDPARNGDTLCAAIEEAATAGAAILFTPEMSGLLDRDRPRAKQHVRAENDDPVLERVRQAAAQHRIWVALGSIALRHDSDARWVNRSILIDDRGEIVTRYDKMHLFDVDLGDQSWRESSAYRPGEHAVVATTPAGSLGLSICYDLRFPALYGALSEAGAEILSVPAAFTVPTGRAHWHTLLRARAIENACWLVAAAQTGKHEDGRETFGHSLVIDPWGEVVLDMGTAPGLGIADIDLAQVGAARGRIPVLAHRRLIPEVERA